MDTAYLRCWITLGAVSGLPSLAAFSALIAARDGLPNPLVALLAGGWGILVTWFLAAYARMLASREWARDWVAG